MLQKLFFIVQKRAKSLTFLWTLLVFYLCLMPQRKIAHIRILGIDKLVHIVLFGGFMFLLLFSIKPNKWMVSFLIATLFGCLIEGLQYYFTSLGRSGDWKDIIADALGAIIFGYLHYILSNTYKNKQA
ncbi:MAG: VanZ family protein [Chitinophagia bacterium]|nr:VanZ family protein [Chitinophagia bacterium]